MVIIDTTFDINPWNDIHAPDFITESVWPSDIILEEAEKDGPATKQNVWRRLWALIRRFLSIIKIKVSQIYQALRSVFKHRQPNDKTLDQIAEHVLGDSPEPPQKHLNFRYEDDKQIRISYLTNVAGKFIKEPKTPGKEKEDRPYLHAILIIFHIIKKPYLLDPILEMMESIKENGGKIVFPIERAQKAMNTILAHTAMGFTITIRLEEWTVLNEKVQRLGELGTIIDDNLTGRVPITVGDQTLTNDWFSVINEFGRLNSALQIGLNLIGDGMRQIYRLDEKYHNKITSQNYREFLPKFIKLCVDSNIPSKYIVQAALDITDTSLNASPGDPEKKIEQKGQKGNGRFVLFPGDPALANVIVKFAFNHLGVRANRIEFDIWEQLGTKGAVGEEIKSRITEIFGIGDQYHHVILAERFGKPLDNYSGASKWDAEMKKLCAKAGLSYKIRTNPGGFGHKRTPDGGYDPNNVISGDFGGVDPVRTTTTT